VEQEQIQSVALEIILHSGSSRTMIPKAFEIMRKKEFANAEKSWKKQMTNYC